MTVPVPKPSVFEGNIFEYPKWEIASFQSATLLIVFVCWISPFRKKNDIYATETVHFTQYKFFNNHDFYFLKFYFYFIYVFNYSFNPLLNFAISVLVYFFLHSALHFFGTAENLWQFQRLVLRYIQNSSDEVFSDALHSNRHKSEGEYYYKPIEVDQSLYRCEQMLWRLPCAGKDQPFIC